MYAGIHYQGNNKYVNLRIATAKEGAEICGRLWALWELGDLGRFMGYKADEGWYMYVQYLYAGNAALWTPIL